MDRRHRVAERQSASCSLRLEEKQGRADHEPAGSLDQSREDRIEVAFGAGVEDMEVQPEGMSRRLQVDCRSAAGRRVDQKSDDSRGGDQLVQQFQPLRRNYRVNWVTPVTLPPGRLRLATRPSWTGSLPISKTIGMVVVAAFAASAAGVLVAAITVTWR